MVTLLAAALALSACAAGLQSASKPQAGGAGASGNNSAPAASSEPAPVPTAAPAAAAASGPQRDLSAAEKKVIMDAVEYNLKDPQTAKYRWTKFPIHPDQDTVEYCATVDAKSPYAPYNGKQAYILEARLANGQVVSATMGLIAGGKDAGIVSKMCAKYGLDPNG